MHLMVSWSNGRYFTAGHNLNPIPALQPRSEYHELYHKSFKARLLLTAQLTRLPKRIPAAVGRVCIEGSIWFDWLCGNKRDKFRQQFVSSKQCYNPVSVRPLWHWSIGDNLSSLVSGIMATYPSVMAIFGLDYNPPETINLPRRRQQLW